MTMGSRGLHANARGTLCAALAGAALAGACGGSTDDASGSGGGAGDAAAGASGSAGVTGVVEECPGYQPPMVGMVSSSDPCRTSDDCTDGEWCSLPGECFPSAVYPGPPPPPDCTTDQECPGEVCNHGWSTCYGDWGSCIPACTTGACGKNMICGTDGHCQPLPCDDGIECSANFWCEPGTAEGCRQKPCAVDGDCDCGACLDGVCQGGLGRCSSLIG